MKRFPFINSRHLIAAGLFILLTPFSVLAQDFEMSDEQKKQFEAQLQQTTERLNLSDEQAIAVGYIISHSMTERMAVMHKYGLSPDNPNAKRPGMRTMRKMRGEMEKLDEEIRTALSDHLTKDQLNTWEQIQSENRERMRQRMRNGN